MPGLVELPSILLVAGSTLTRKSIQRLLSGQFKIQHVEDSTQAWELLQQDMKITAVLSELEQCIDQTALLERIRQSQNKSIASLPVLLLVGESDDETRRDQAFSVGATDFISMPFSSTELKTRVRLHSGLYHLHSNENAFEVSEQNSSVDLLNTLLQEQHFISRLDQEVSFSIRHKSYVSVCLLQIDQVEDIIDDLGSKVLSAVLRSVGKLIEQQIRREDTYAYLGNGVYALLYPVTNGLGANVATKRLIDKIISSRLMHEGEAIPITLSGGLYSSMPVEQQSAADIMQVLHQRLEHAQRMGGGELVSSKTEQEQDNVSLGQALNMISFNRTEGLEKQLPQLLDTLMPLLAYAREHNSLDLEAIIESLQSSED